MEKKKEDQTWEKVWNNVQVPMLRLMTEWTSNHSVSSSLSSNSYSKNFSSPTSFIPPTRTFSSSSTSSNTALLSLTVPFNNVTNNIIPTTNTDIGKLVRQVNKEKKKEAKQKKRKAVEPEIKLISFDSSNLNIPVPSPPLRQLKSGDIFLTSENNRWKVDIRYDYVVLCTCRECLANSAEHHLPIFCLEERMPIIQESKFPDNVPIPALPLPCLAFSKFNSYSIIIFHVGGKKKTPRCYIRFFSNPNLPVESLYLKGPLLNSPADYYVYSSLLAGGKRARRAAVNGWSYFFVFMIHKSIVYKVLLDAFRPKNKNDNSICPGFKPIYQYSTEQLQAFHAMSKITKVQCSKLDAVIKNKKEKKKQYLLKKKIFITFVY